jgi:hypothetical protein
VLQKQISSALPEISIFLQFIHHLARAKMQSLSSLSPSCSITSSPSKFKAMQVKASWDTTQQQKLPYNRNAPRKLTQSQSPSLTSSSPTAPSTRKEHLISDLLKRTTPLPTIPSTNYSILLLLFPLSFNFNFYFFSIN